MSSIQQSSAAARPQANGAVRVPIDVAHSRVGFRVRKMGLYYVKGRFTRAHGWIEKSPDGAPLRAQLEIDAASITTRIPPRDWHLRSRDFLDVARHPAMRVVVDTVEMRDGELSALATFTIRGVSRPVQLRGHVHGDGSQAVLHLQTTLDRREFGVRPRRPVEWIVAPEVQVDALIAFA